MKIANDEELLNKIDRIRSIVEPKTRDIPEASIYQDIYKKLLKIDELIELNEFSLQAKQSCDMGGALASLYEGMTSLPQLGESLCAINAYYQDANITTLDKDQAKEFLRMSGTGP